MSRGVSLAARTVLRDLRLVSRQGYNKLHGTHPLQMEVQDCHIFLRVYCVDSCSCLLLVSHASLGVIEYYL